MKTLTTLTAAVALIAGMSIASAQTTSPSTSPGASGAPMKSGSSAADSKMQVTGTGKFCVEQSPGGALDCKFASMAACETEGKPNNRDCKANPNTGGTTGAR